MLLDEMTEDGPLSTRAVVVLGIFYLFAAMILALSGTIGAEVRAAFSMSSKGYPYPVLSDAALLYLKLPLTFLASLYFWMAPGLMIVLAYALPRRFTEWAVLGFLAAFLAQVISISLGKLVVGRPLDRTTFLICSVATGALAWLLLWNRVRQGQRLLSPLASVWDMRRAIVTVLIPCVGLLLLLPFLFWQDLNPDGVEAVELGASLAWHYLPRTLTPSGFIPLGIGNIAQSYPYHSFMMLFGPIEAAVRLPFLLFLPVIFCALIELIEWGGKGPLEQAHEGLLVLALAIYTVVMCFNASYYSYFADISVHAVQDTMVILCMLGALQALCTHRTLAFVSFAVLGYFCRPTGLLFLLLLFSATVMVMRGSWRQWLARISLAIFACIALILLYQGVVLGDQHAALGSDSILGRLRYLRFFDWKRIAFLIFPSGILPAAALFLYKKQDIFSRVITIITVAYFLFFYMMAFIALHHFVPVMILPLIVFWRIFLDAPLSQRRIVLSLAIIGGCLSLWLSLPKHFEVNRITRAIGERTRFLVGDPAKGLQSIVREADVLTSIVRYDWTVKDPSREFVGSPLGVVYYAARSGPIDAADNYIVLPDSESPPLGTSKVKEHEGVILYVRNLEMAHQDRFRPLNTDYRSPLYAIPRETLFKHWGVRQKRYDLDAAAFLRLWRKIWMSRHSWFYADPLELHKTAWRR